MTKKKAKRGATRPPPTRVESTGYVGSEHITCRCVWICQLGPPSYVALHRQVCMVGRSATCRGIKSGVQSLLVHTLYFLNGFLIIRSSPRCGWVWFGCITGDLSGKEKQHVRVGWRPFAPCQRFIHLRLRTKPNTGGVECVHWFRHVFFPEAFMARWVPFLLFGYPFRSWQQWYFFWSRQNRGLSVIFQLSSWPDHYVMPGSLCSQRRIPLKKSLATPFTSALCTSRSTASLSGFLSLTWDFLTYIDVKVSALAMLGYLPQGVASTSSSTFVCLQDTLIILTNFPKASVASKLNLQMSVSSMHILRIVILPVLQLKSRGKLIKYFKDSEFWRRCWQDNVWVFWFGWCSSGYASRSSRWRLKEHQPCQWALWSRNWQCETSSGYWVRQDNFVGSHGILTRSLEASVAMARLGPPAAQLRCLSR